MTLNLRTVSLFTDCSTIAFTLVIYLQKIDLYPPCSFLGNCEEELPKKPVGRLSVNCRPSVDRQVTDSLPTVNQQVTDRLRKKENCGKHEQLT